MPDSVAAVAGATVNPISTVNPLGAYSQPVASPDDNSTIDKDAFLKLLVAQLKYQDPLEPSSNEEFIATTAQFTTVERLNELTAQGRTQATTAALNTAGSLVGREVSVMGGAGYPVTLTVNQARLVGGDVQLVTDQGVIGLNQIIAIGPQAGTTVGGSDATDTSGTDAGAGSTDNGTTETTSPTDTSDTTSQETIQ